MKGHVLFQGEIIMKQRKYIDEILKSSQKQPSKFLKNNRANFNQTRNKTSLDKGHRFELVQMKGHAFHQGEIITK